MGAFGHPQFGSIQHAIRTAVIGESASVPYKPLLSARILVSV